MRREDEEKKRHSDKTERAMMFAEAQIAVLRCRGHFLIDNLK